MLFHKQEATIKSEFPQNEKFRYDTVPKYFKSVTINSLRSIKNYCAYVVRQKFNGKFEPNTLQEMLKTIDGEFDHAYALLNDDYNTRYRNLQEAYATGLAKIEKEFLNFKKLVNDHDLAFQAYDEIHQALIGHPLDQKLLYSENDLDELEQQYKTLQKQTKE